MSEELEWELYDIFASGIFAFPIYEHNSARRIVRYLLMRGVPAEDVAAAIEDHAVDLRSWLERRPGHHMVGEWVMAWLNDSRDQYKAGRREQRLDRRRRRWRRHLSGGSPSTSRTTPRVDDDVDEDEVFYGFPVRGDRKSIETVSSTTVSSTTTSDDSDSSDTYREFYADRRRRGAIYDRYRVRDDDDDERSDSISGAVIGVESENEMYVDDGQNDDEDSVESELRQETRSCPELGAAHRPDETGSSYSAPGTGFLLRPTRSADDLLLLQMTSASCLVSRQTATAAALDIEPEVLASAALQRRQAAETDAIDYADQPDSGNVSDMQCACASIACCGCGFGGGEHDPYCDVVVNEPYVYHDDQPIDPLRPPSPCDGCYCTLPHYVISKRSSGCSSDSRIWSPGRTQSEPDLNNGREGQWTDATYLSTPSPPPTGAECRRHTEDWTDGMRPWNDIPVCALPHTV